MRAGDETPAPLPVPRAWHAAALGALVALGLLHGAGWLGGERIPPDDAAGYAAVLQDVRDTLVREGRLPAWSPRWFGGTSRFTSSLKELLALPLALGLDPLRALLLATLLVKLGSGLALYAFFVRAFRAPSVGIAAAYAFAFSTFSSYQRGLDTALSALLLALLLLAALELGERATRRGAVAVGVLVACTFANNFVQAALCPVLVALTLALRPWRGTSVPQPPGSRPALARSGALLALALGVFLVFAASQLAWYALDRSNHLLHPPEIVAVARRVFIHHSPASFLNRGNWLGGWLLHHHPPDMYLFPTDPLTNQRYYLGAVPMGAALLGWLAARRDRSRRRWFQLFALLFLVQWWLAMGDRSLAWLVARQLHLPEERDAAIRIGLDAAALALLAAAGALAWRARRGRGPARPERIELLFGTALVAFAAAQPLFGALRRALPILDGMRSPGHFLDVGSLPLYALFGLGLLALSERLSRPRARHALVALVVALAAVDFWSGRAAFQGGKPYAPVRELRERVAALRVADEPERLLPYPWTRGDGWLPASLVAVNSPANAGWGWLTWQASEAWLELAVAATAWLDERSDAERRARLREIADALCRIGRFRWLLYERAEGRALRPGAPWVRLVANERFGLWERPEVLPMAWGMRAFSLVVGREGLAGTVLAARAFLQGAALVSGGARLAEAPASLVEEAVAIAGVGDAAFADAESGSLALRQRAKVLRVLDEELDTEPPGALGPGPAAPLIPVRARRPEPERILLELDAGAEPAVVVVSEAHHPWWRAAVDGEPATLLRAEHALLALRVGPGAHRVELRFEPPLAVRAADAVSTAAWAALALAGALAAWRALAARIRSAGRGPR
jgi:hypothetical protein